MRNELMALALGGGLLLLAQSRVLAVSLTETESNQQQANSGQVLPVSAQTEIGGQTIDLEVVQTPEQDAMGLTNRTTLADDRGMLFPYNPPEVVEFWMKDVLIPLDMIFLLDKKVLGIAANVPPCPAEPCQVYFPAVDTAQGIGGIFASEPVTSDQAITLPENIELVPVDQVIELRGGRTGELGLKAGDSVSVAAVPEPSSVLGILAFGALGAGSLLKRKLRSK